MIYKYKWLAICTFFYDGESTKMERKNQLWRLVCMVALVNGVGISESAAVNQVVVGAKSGLAVKNWDGTTQYTLILASFPQKKDALHYQQNMKKYLSAPVYVQYVGKSAQYIVATGPITNIYLLHRISKEAMNHSPEHAQTVVTSNRNTHHAYPLTFRWPWQKGTVTPVNVTPVNKVPRVEASSFQHSTQSSQIKAPQVSKVSVQNTTYHPFIQMPSVKNGHWLTEKGNGIPAIPPVKRNPQLTTIQPGGYFGMTTGGTVNMAGEPAVYGAWQGTAFGGFSVYALPWLNIAGEVFGSNNREWKQAHVTPLPSAKSGWSYGVSAMPGVLANDTSLFYVRLGYLWTHFLPNVDRVIPPVSDSVTGHYPDFTNYGFQVGLGLQSKIYQHLELRLESTFAPHEQKLELVDRAHMYNVQFNVGLVYKIQEEK